MAESFTSADFHNVAHKQMLNIVFDTLSKAKLDWQDVAPLLEAARQICRSDFEQSGRARVHALRAEGDGVVEAEEAYVAISIADRESGEEWLAETWWLSDLVIGDNDPAKAQLIISALEKSIARIRSWIDQQTGPGSETGAPSPAS
jgi:hypothetical protein